MAALNRIEKIAVIGAGPAGLTAAKYLLAEDAFTKIAVFDQRSEVGGVWNYSFTPSKSKRSDLTIPRTKPSPHVEQPVTSMSRDSGEVGFCFPSPIYDFLETNIPHTLMNFSDKTFLDGCSLFPKFGVVKTYLEEYADDVRHLLRLGTQIISLEKEAGEKWKILSHDIKTQRDEEEIYDAVVVASGHYSDPFIPDIEGIRDFHTRHPEVISHSKYYRRPEGYAGKKVIIIGNSASGIDISSQISVHTSQVIVSEKEKPSTVHNTSSTITYMPEIATFLPDQRGVRFTNGHTETDIDDIIFCTGYQYSFPFLQTLDPPPVTDGQRTRCTYEHIFYYPAPTLAFLTLPQRIVPFPVAEAQAGYVARVFSGRCTLPPASAMAAWEARRVEEKGDGKAFHNLAFPADVEYINRLCEYSMEASVVEGKGKGKVPPYWDEEKRWVRERFPAIKQAVLALGEEKRGGVKRLEDLGFDFGEWKRGQGRGGEESGIAAVKAQELGGCTQVRVDEVGTEV
ncbi:putative flavin dependent monooxygenase [Polyplosphaeria fusca]|uniref:Flavin dependent monooxygenase n=1 Tax=Polyplosphaeria fusca TaxID=682080 RepID=A0A9P4VA03_9PLEO|nr:putative flavin dependent monooxygenase [Polyplosphaeria fusca]